MLFSVREIEYASPPKDAGDGLRITHDSHARLCATICFMFSVSNGENA